MSEQGVRFSSIKEVLDKIRAGAKVRCDYCGKPLDANEEEIVFSGSEPLKIYHSSYHNQRKREGRGSCALYGY